MKSQKVNDLQYRKNYRKYEAKRLLLKYLLLQQDSENSSLATETLSEGWKQRMKHLQKIPRNSSKGRLRGRCVITNRPRSVNQLLRISRQETRRLALTGKLPGVKRSTW